MKTYWQNVCGRSKKNLPKAYGFLQVCAIFRTWEFQDALATLRRHENALRSHGVAHAAVFGSVARGENRPDSDLDILN
jgi:hypothetical protein